MAKKKKDGSNTGSVIRNFVERYESLEEQKTALAEDFKTLGQQIKSEGFDASIVKALVKIKKNETKAREHYQLLSTYASACQLDLFGESLTEAAQ